MRTITALAALLVAALLGLWLQPTDLRISGDDIAPLRWEKPVASVPISSAGSGPCLAVVSQDGGRSGVPVYTTCGSTSAITMTGTTWTTTTGGTR